MKCSACGAEIDSTILNCIYCGSILGDSESANFTIQNSQDDYYCTKYLDSNGNKILKSREVLFMYNDAHYPWFYSVEIENQKKYFLVFSKIINGKEFTWNNRYNNCYLNLIFKEKEQIKYQVKYHDYSNYHEMLGAQSQKVNFRFPFSYTLLVKLLDSSGVKIILDETLPIQGVTFNEFSLSDDLKLDLFGFHNSVFGYKRRKSELMAKKQQDENYNYALENGITDFDEIDKRLSLSGNDFKNWVDQTNKETQIHESTIRENTAEKERQKVTLRKWDDASGVRMFANAFFSIGLLIFLWIKIDFKVGLSVVIVYNVIFTIWVKNKSSILKKRIKELEQAEKK